MLIPMSEIQERWGVNPRVVVHAGAHELQEAQAYSEAGAERVLWVEGDRDTVRKARAIAVRRRDGVDHRVAHAMLASKSGETVTFHVTNNGQSSSIFPLGTHLQAHPEVVETATVEYVTRTLDEVADEFGFMGADFLNCDVQAAEGEVLRGSPRLLESVQALVLEANIRELYRGGIMLPELDALINGYGFEVVELRTAGCRYEDCSDGGQPRFVGWADLVALRVDDPVPYRERFAQDWSMWYPEDAP